LKKKIKIIIENKEKDEVKYYFHTIYLNVLEPKYNSNKEYSGSTAGVARIVLKETYAFDPDTNNQDKQFYYQAYLMPGEPGEDGKGMKNCGDRHRPVDHPPNGRRYTKYEAIEDALVSCNAYKKYVEAATNPGKPGTLKSVSTRRQSKNVWQNQPHLDRPSWAPDWATDSKRSK
tara:strand:- start:150 stop:671 length:522 start_codon:yes stop_codon:yes gene_type:complete